MKKVFLSNKIQINALKHLIMLSFISNLIEGFAFSQLLQIPYLDFFSKLFVGSNQILVVAQLLFFYRFGRLMISLSDSRLPSFVHNNYLEERDIQTIQLNFNEWKQNKSAFGYGCLFLTQVGKYE